MPRRALLAWTLLAGVVGACGDGGSSGTASSSGASGSNGGGAGASGSSGSSGGDAAGGGTGGGAPGPGTFHAGCRVFPNDNPWNTDVSGLPVDTALTTEITALARDTSVHPDWGTFTEQYGIPITTGRAAQPAPVTWSTSYGARESDPLPCPGGSGDFCYPIPLDAKIEGGPGASPKSDRHVLFVATDGAPDHCVLYELYGAQNPTGGGWTAASGAIWKLDSNALRTEGWTSADAAGLPVLAGLVRREEIERGEIPHALRFTMDRTRQAYVHPATHAAGDADASLPPMGLRVRLRASFDDAGFSKAAKIVTTAMKKYGMLLADNGSSWYVSGETSDAWGPEMDALNADLGKVKGSDFEIVKTGDVVVPPP